MNKYDIPPLKLEEFKEAFRLFDVDKNGTISTSELHHCMKCLGLSVTPAQIQTIMAQVDNDCNNVISFDEFVELMMLKFSMMNPEDDISEAFKLFDRDGNGFVSVAELKQVLCNMGDRMTDEDMEDLLREAEPDKDGMVDYIKIVNMMMARP